ncbi:MAG: hypothetical protein JNJ58_10115 [Chitinophagaceae bacterium]|nr:hypothetical protein [Chitinophagaceae bacterium]
MDALQLLERIKDPGSLKNDHPYIWKEVCESYPYFTAAHYLAYGNDAFFKREDIHRAAAYKADPLQFAVFVRNIAQAVEQESSVTELPVSSAESVESPQPLIQSEKDLNVSEPVIVQPETNHTQQKQYSKGNRKKDKRSKEHHPVSPKTTTEIHLSDATPEVPAVEEVKVSEPVLVEPEMIQETKQEVVVEETVKQEEIVETESVVTEVIIESNLQEPAQEAVPEDSTVTHQVTEEKTVTAELTSESTPETGAPDILTLINELPNEPIFERTFKSPPAKKETEDLISDQTESISEDIDEALSSNLSSVSNTTEEEEDKSLMVMMSFTDWLFHFKTKAEREREEERAQKALKTAWQKEKLTAAMEEEEEEIPEQIFKQAMDSISSESGIISESLAKVLAAQGKHDKAIAMYKKLSLRNPEKNAYFADRIKELNDKY